MSQRCYDLFHFFLEGFLVEAEVLSILFCEISEVKSNAHNIRLSSVVFLVTIIVNDKIVAVWQRSSNVLELLHVEWIRKNVIGMNSLQSCSFGHFRKLRPFVSFVSQNTHFSKVFTSVAFLFYRPRAILLIERRPIIINHLVNFKICDA